MRVVVDEPGQAGRPAEVDHGRPGRSGEATADLADAIALDQDRHVFGRGGVAAVEEAPAADLPSNVSDVVLESATRLIGSLHYAGAATCEFLVDQKRGTAAFLEINARLQVEHPVTEMVTGIDIVREQLRIAGGAPLSVAQPDVGTSGHAIEARVNAESPSHGFMPTPGVLTVWAAPEGADIRVDTACFPGWRITPYYDSLLAKVIARGAERPTAIDRLRAALAHVRVEGVQTNIAFTRDVLDDPDVRAGNVHTRWLEDVFMPNWHPGAVAA